MLPLLAIALVCGLATRCSAQGTYTVLITPTATGWDVTIGTNPATTFTSITQIQQALSTAMTGSAGTYSGTWSVTGGSSGSFSFSDASTLSSTISSFSSAYSATSTGTSTSGTSTSTSESSTSTSESSSSDGSSGGSKEGGSKEGGSGEGKGGKGNKGKHLGQLKIKCFSADTRVNTDRGEMSMEELLKAGDISVQVGSGQMAPITSWIHAQPEAMTQFNKITTEAGSVSVTDGHLVYLADGQVVSAGKVKLGDRLMTAERNPVEVINVEKIESKGYYAPLTSTGDIVVNGHLASCYSEVESPVLAEIMFKYIQAFAGTILPQSVQAKLFNVGRPETVMAFIELSQKFMA